jgi:Protein of unknown function (DUF3455)
MRKPFLAPWLLGALAACSSPPSAPVAPVPEALKPAPPSVAGRTLLARGVQIYECRAKQGDAQASEWAFVAPEAELLDARGKKVGRHFAGPRWESAADGSQLLGAVQARADAPRAGAIPWLLLSTKAEGPRGEFSSTSNIQRINTQGGVAPAGDECTAASRGRTVRVPYTADYVYFGVR